MKLAILLGLLALGCDERPLIIDGTDAGGADASAASPCRKCGDDGFTCSVTLTECIQAGTCETHGPGELVLYSDGTYKQQAADGSTNVGMYQYKNGILFVNGAIIPWSLNICKHDSDAGV